MRQTATLRHVSTAFHQKPVGTFFTFHGPKRGKVLKGSPSLDFSKYFQLVYVCDNTTIFWVRATFCSGHFAWWSAYETPLMMLISNFKSLTCHFT